jgi:hypothetical protein
VAKVLSDIDLDHPLLLARKARELTYAHQNIFRSNRIITDLRPVFDKSGGEMKGVVLTHVLSVEYFDGVRKQRIEFALDQNDVKALRESAARAELKTQTTREAFKGKLPLLVAGDPSPME